MKKTVSVYPIGYNKFKNRGMNIRDYVNKYDILSGKKEAVRADKNGKDDEIMEQIAELESELELEMRLQKDCNKKLERSKCNGQKSRISLSHMYE